MPKFKRIYFDIETSLLKAWIWKLGKQYVGPESIKEEAQIICICYKWEHEKKVQSLDWTDPDMLQKFVATLNEADEIVGHNGKSFDLRWVMWECLKKRIPAFPTYKLVDTLSIMRSKFRAPSNRLNYLSQVLFGTEKKETGGLALWHQVMDGCEKALAKMISYCKNDVLLLEELFLLIQDYVPIRTNHAVMQGGERWCCPKCGSENVKHSKVRVSAAGIQSHQMQCQDCGRYFTVSNTVYNNMIEEEN